MATQYCFSTKSYEDLDDYLAGVTWQARIDCIVYYRYLMACISRYSRSKLLSHVLTCMACSMDSMTLIVLELNKSVYHKVFHKEEIVRLPCPNPQALRRTTWIFSI